MEYLMSYSWAILVIMVVGVVMWQLGIFEIGGDAVTVTGFPSIKPILATCQAGNVPSQWGTSWRGIICQFTNSAAAEIELKNFWITIEDEECYYTYGGWIGPPWEYIYKQCDPVGICDITPQGTAVYPGDPIFGDGIINVGNEGTFQLWASEQGDETICGQLEPGQTVKAEVKIEYEITIGGLMTIKQESGSVQMTST
jgi:hypothetical protein